MRNVNGAVDSILVPACLDRILAQVEVAFSNSLVEAYWRSLKHQWLFLNTLDSVGRVRVMVEIDSRGDAVANKKLIMSSHTAGVN
jgi:putative transposase